MQILTPTGNKPIEEIQVGDDVLAFDVFTGEQIVNTVLEKTLWNFSPESPFFDGKFYTINGTWKCYGEQSIWRNDNQVVHAKHLVVGDIIFNGSDEDVVVTSIEETTDTEWYKFEISGDHSYIVDNLTLHNASRFWVLGTGTWDSSTTTQWAATSNGAGGSSVPGSADTVTFDASSGGGTVTPNYDMTVTSITMGAFTGTLDFSTNNNSPTMSTFSGTGTGTRTLSMGSGTWTLTGNATTVWTTATNTNLTINKGTSTIDCTYSGSTGTRIITQGNNVANQLNIIKISAGTDTFQNNGTACVDVDFTGFSGTFGGSSTMTISGSWTSSSTMTDSSTGTITFTSTSGTKTITSGGTTMPRSLTFNGVGGTWQLSDALTLGSTNTLTLINGTFDANNFNVSCGLFASNNSNIRTLNMGSGTWNITGNAGTIWQMATTTGLTVNAGTSTVNLTYSGSTGTRTFNPTTNVTLNNVNVTAGTDTVGMATQCNNLDFTGFSGVLGTNSSSIQGNLTFGTGMTTTTSSSSWTYNGTTGTQLIDTKGIQWNVGQIINTTGSTVKLMSNLDITGANSRTLTITAGTFDANGYNLSMAFFSSSNSNTRSILMGSGTWTLTSTGTIWTTATSTNITLTPGTSTIDITDTSIASKTFSGGSLTYYNLKATGDNIIVSGSNTFNILNLNNAGLTTGLSLTAGTTTTVSGMTNNGSAGNLTKLISTSAGTPATISKASGTVSLDYMSIKDSTATGGAIFYAGANSTNVSGNTGWFFTAAPTGGSGVTIGNSIANSIINGILI